MLVESRKDNLDPKRAIAVWCFVDRVGSFVSSPYVAKVVALGVVSTRTLLYPQIGVPLFPNPLGWLFTS